MNPDRLVNCPACRISPTDDGVHGRVATRNWRRKQPDGTGKAGQRLVWDWAACRRCRGHGVIPADQLKPATP